MIPLALKVQSIQPPKAFFTKVTTVSADKFYNFYRVSKSDISRLMFDNTTDNCHRLTHI